VIGLTTRVDGEGDLLGRSGGRRLRSPFLPGILVVVRQTRRDSLFGAIDFSRAYGERVVAVITDFGIQRPMVPTRELVVTGLHPGISVEECPGGAGWPSRRR